MATVASHVLPKAVLASTENGVSVIRAYREYLGYSIEDAAITSGLTAREIEQMEAGLRFDKGYRERLARAFGLSDNAFDEASGISDAAA
ncbi:helix-turn-helix domain-containing protein [Aquamicrobium segne]|uniref:Helix-turn-helix domain-containing protein n=1 Tax=Aquamicrobium segne TaxID=469547 RepID=A0ABW0H0G6_9HYPH